MKKLLLLLLLTASFSTFALSFAPLIPCGFTLDVEANKATLENLELERNTLIKKLEELRIANKKNYIEINKLKRDIFTLSEELVGKTLFLRGLQDENSYSSELCKQSPEGLSLDESGKVVENGIRVGKWTWYDKFNRVIKQGNYVNGKKEGKWTEWIFNEHAYDTIKMNYKNDKLDGKWTHWISSNPYNFHQINDLQFEIHLIEFRIHRLEEGINEEAKQSWDEPYSIEELQEQKRLLEIELSGLETPRIYSEKIYKDGVLIEN